MNAHSAEKGTGRIDALRIESDDGTLTFATRHDGRIEAQTSGERVVFDREAVVRLAYWLTEHGHIAERDAGRVLRHKPEFTTNPADTYDIPPLPDAEKDVARHAPDLTSPLPDPFAKRLPACTCGRTFSTWRAQGIHETQANRRDTSPGVGA